MTTRSYNFWDQNHEITVLWSIDHQIFNLKITGTQSSWSKLKKKDQDDFSNLDSPDLSYKKWNSNELNNTYLDLYWQPLIIAISRFIERNFYTWFTILFFTLWFGLFTLDPYYSEISEQFNLFVLDSKCWFTIYINIKI